MVNPEFDLQGNWNLAQKDVVSNAQAECRFKSELYSLSDTVQTCIQTVREAAPSEHNTEN